MSKLAKKVAIIMVMPSPMPMFGRPHMEVMGLPHPPLPAPPHVVAPMPFPPPMPMLAPPGMPVPTLNSPVPVMPPQAVALPAPPQTCYPCPPAPTYYPCAPVPGDINITLSKANPGVDTCLQFMGLANDLYSVARTPNMPSLCASALGLLMDLCPATCMQTSPRYLEHPPQYIPPSPPFPLPRELAAQEAAAAQSCPHGLCGNMVFAPERVFVESYTVAAPATAAKIHILATPSSDELEMNVGGTCIRCKKMTVTIGEQEIALSRFDDRVRVRGEELKATAGSVRSDSKDRLILEGDVVLHYKKDGHSANVTGDRIELNLCSGAVTIKPAERSVSSPAVQIPGP